MINDSSETIFLSGMAGTKTNWLQEQPLELFFEEMCFSELESTDKFS